MSPARRACEPQLYTSTTGSGDPEFARVLRISDPGPALEGPLTFAPPAGVVSGNWLAAWHEWRGTVLASQLASALLQAAALAGRGCAREMQALDRELDASLDNASRQRSRLAGQRLLARLASSRGDRWLGRFQQWVAAGEMSAHFPVVYAGQHAVFHLPLRLLVPAHAYWEWSAAMSVLPPTSGPALDFASETDALCRLAQIVLPSAHAVENLPAASCEC